MSFKEKCLEKLRYDAETGLLTWVSNGTRGVKSGDVAGYKMKDGYILLSVAGKRVLAHRVAWLFAYGDFPEGNLDHINRDRADNRICNLRNAAPAQNAQNRAKNRLNTSGYKGVTWHKRDKKWQAGLTLNGKTVHLGLYDTAEAAYEAYKAGSKKHQTHSIFKGE